jgi:UDPglucose--hexose-1-phosphate uridylyltransferase
MSAIIDKLIHYGRFHLGLHDEDVIYVRNRLLELLGIDSYEHEDIDCKAIEHLSVPDVLLSELRQFMLDYGFADDATIDRRIGAIIGTLTPLPSTINKRFRHLYDINPRQATDYLYNLQIKNDYIKKTFVDTNIHWIANFSDNYLEITINMSKPEKRNEDIAKLVKAKATGYPKCVLCEDNIGYYGRDDHPNRTNIRTIDLMLDDEEWFFQYSPYVYYDRHCIVIDKIHRPMEVSDRTIRKLLAFVEQFPHFFIGSNSDLPLVGGSILNHEHFQGGAHLMPLMYARLGEEISFSNSPNVKANVLLWYNTAFLLQSEDKEQILEVANKIIATWRPYSDKKRNIIAQTDAPHNTATVLARIEEGKYLVYIILRNNRKSEQYPEGIFHAHREYHHIKSEGIGLIEASGLFILPARLKRQLQAIEEGIKDGMTAPDIIARTPDLAIHQTMIEQLIDHPESDVKKQITKYVNDVCRHILINTSVFKPDDDGRRGLDAFIKEVLR